MLESLRKQGASAIIYLIFGLLIVIFVINFAPNAGQGGCSPAGNTVLSVNGDKVNQTSYKIAFSANRFPDRWRTYGALDMLIRRELLAQEAEARGIRVSGDLVHKEIMKGVFFYAGYRIADFKRGQWRPPFVAAHNFLGYDEKDPQDLFFNGEKFDAWVGMFNVSKGSYIDEQVRAMQAAMMAELLAQSVQVSRDEARAGYLFEHNTVSYDVVTFNSGAYRKAMRLTDADIQRFLATHEAEVKAKYTADERTYKATQPALRLRSIFIAKAEPAAPADGPKPADPANPTATPSQPAPAKPAAKPGMTIEEAKTKLEAARTAIAAGKQKFGDAVKQLSTEEAAKANGGDLGWRSIASPGFRDPAVDAAVKTLKPGEMTPVIVTDGGVYLVTAEAKREGDLSFDQVKLDIAADLAKATWSKERAKRDAIAALNETRAAQKPLNERYEKGDAGLPGGAQPQLPEGLPDDIRRQLEEQLNKQKTGSIVVESKDIPAGWYAGDETPSAAPGSAAPAGAGSARGSGSAGSAAGSTAAPTPPAAPPPDTPKAPVVESKDTLPQFVDIPKPVVVRHGPAPRVKQLPGIGSSAEVLAAVFDELAPGDLAKTVFEVQDNYIVLQLISHEQPKLDEFDKVAAERIATLRAIRGQVVVEEWVRERCTTLAKENKIEVVDQERIREVDEKGNPAETIYHPCITMTRE
ncbi:MAG: peptidylprolyl isomerase [Kofleriaceae bacterium]